MDAVLNLPRVKVLLSDEHFSVDGTLIQAWASMKSFRRKDGNDEPPSPGRNGERNFHKEKRSNETHASTTDPDARLARKSNGEGAKLAFTGHLLMENRNGLVVDACLTHATGTAEPEAALAMLEALPEAGHKTVGADKAYDTAAFVASSRDHPARGADHQRASRIEHRRANDAACWLPGQSGRPQADRGSERLDQGGRRHGANQAARGEAGGMDVRVEGSGLQSDPLAATAGNRITAPKIRPRPHQRLCGAAKTAESCPGNPKSKQQSGEIQF